MSHDANGDSRLFVLLLKFDRDLVAEARKAACRVCGAPLHQRNYPRKPRGGPADLADDYKLRYSLCCSKLGCRTSATPPSVRFFGRRFYLGAVLVWALRDGLSARRVVELNDLIGVSVRTLRRWRDWWRETFAVSRFWKSVRDRFSPPVDAADAPSSLLNRFDAGRDGLISLLQFLSPITTGAGLAMAG